MNLFIYGSGGTGCEMLDISQRRNIESKLWDNIFFVDDIRTERLHYGTRVFNFEEMIGEKNLCECIIAQGEPSVRRALYEKLTNANISLATLIDTSAIISPSAQIYPGCVIWPGAFISSSARLQKNVMVQINSVIGHGASLGEHSVISSSAAIGGDCIVGVETFIGMGANAKEGTRIGDRAILGMGASLFNDLEADLIALGNPARSIQRNTQGKVFKR